MVSDRTDGLSWLVCVSGASKHCDWHRGEPLAPLIQLRCSLGMRRLKKARPRPAAGSAVRAPRGDEHRFSLRLPKLPITKHAGTRQRHCPGALAHAGSRSHSGATSRPQRIGERSGTFGAMYRSSTGAAERVKHRESLNLSQRCFPRLDRMLVPRSDIEWSKRGAQDCAFAPDSPADRHFSSPHGAMGCCCPARAAGRFCSGPRTRESPRGGIDVVAKSRRLRQGLQARMKESTNGGTAGVERSRRAAVVSSSEAVRTASRASAKDSPISGDERSHKILTQEGDSRPRSNSA
jgi:hypothetical protein